MEARFLVRFGVGVTAVLTPTEVISWARETPKKSKIVFWQGREYSFLPDKCQALARDILRALGLTEAATPEEIFRAVRQRGGVITIGA